MKVYPFAKINLGLNIVRRRDDGYHDIETVFYPIPLRDALEVLPPDGEGTGAGCALTVTSDDALTAAGCGLPERHDVTTTDNLVVKAYHIIRETHTLPDIRVLLRKSIPIQAGLGGGSADGAFMLKLLCAMFDINMPAERQRALATRIGADCPFFISGTPAYAEGIGDRLTPIDVDLQGWYIGIVKPPVAVSTKEAYAHVVPATPSAHCREIVRQSPDQWRGSLVNDFEASIFRRFPLLAKIKERLYDDGAAYAAMSGSGSALYGLFKSAPDLSAFDGMFVYSARL